MAQFHQRQENALFHTASIKLVFNLLNVLIITAQYAKEMEYQKEEMDEVRRDEQLVLPEDLDYMR